MGVQALQSFAVKGPIEGLAEPAELILVARSFLVNRPKPVKVPLMNNKLALILDAECCLDRLYGGFFSDWTCGGQWNRMIQFLNQLFSACQKGNIELIIAFNGALEQQRMSEWAQSQQSYRQNVQMVLRHVQIKGTPPPKVWWVPPTCLSTALRLALRYLNIPMLCSMDDHHQEVLAYCRENNVDGIMGDDADYLVFDPPRYFSASGLKLTFKGFLETKEFFPKKLLEGLQLDSLGLCILTALLGNYMLTETQLAGLHNKLKIATVKDPSEKIPVLAEFVKSLENRDNLDDVATEIFSFEKSDKAAKKRQLFVESVQYYLNGTKDGFLKYSSRKVPKKVVAKSPKETNGGAVVESTSNECTSDLDVSRFASETAENEAGSLEAYTQLASSKGVNSGENAESPTNGRTVSSTVDLNGSSSCSSEAPASGENEKRKRPILPPEVVRTAGERHLKGVMSPALYQILTQGEMKLPVLLEDEMSREIPSIHHVYLPVRQSIYAILFNVHHQQYLAREQGDKTPLELPTVKEWLYPYVEPEIVRAEPVSWSVPTVQRLWFGTNVEDMRRRLRAFLTCMKSDSPLMVSSAYVPQHLLVMASVLRYLMQSPSPILRQLELDAFIVTAFCPDLMDAEYTQELQLPIVTARGVQLATLFMQGVETAILANEACGAPIPYLMSCPWLYFDGKLFHNILAKTEFVKSLQELCNHRMDVLVKVERMRHAILENLHVQYARRGIGNMGNSALPYVANSMNHAGYNGGGGQMERRGGMMRGNQRRQLSARGGQLEVAGVVVCSWGPNYSLARDRNQPPPLAGVGGRGYSRNYSNNRGGYSMNGRGGFGGRRRPTGGRKPRGKKNGRAEVLPNANPSQQEHSGSSEDVGSSSDETPQVVGQFNGPDDQEESHA